jgi:squalene-hopene/tetraprenyl-beta-curcumene cyclase
MLRSSLLPALFSAALFAQSPASPSGRNAVWDAKAAASYLDGRMEWWITWSSAQRDHETFCVSCHTVLPYALGRPALHAAESPAAERKLLDNITKRVRMWQDVAPFYPDSAKSPGKTPESRGTESVLNALILASRDSAAGSLSPDAKLALDNMWGQQIKSGEAAGAWPWLQFHNAPWEGDSQYWGSTLAALAIGMAPGGYRDTPAIQEGLGLLRAYLARERSSQKLVDRMVLLWASTRIPSLLTADERNAIIAEAVSKQQEDGGFSLSAFVGSWTRRDKTPLESKSDGYATGLVSYVLRQTGMKSTDPVLRRSLDWLKSNQEASDGRWQAYSLNKQREPLSDAGLFMSDAATAFAVLALGSE